MSKPKMPLIWLYADVWVKRKRVSEEKKTEAITIRAV